MYPSLRLRAVRGFTLIELLIVVIIIAILAAIAIPQFSNSSGDAQESALDANLATMRSAIELYRVQHANNYPGTYVSTGGTGCLGTVGTGAAKSEAAMKDQLTAFSNAAGQTCSVTSPGFIYGPYLRGVPAEPIQKSATITMIDGVMTNPLADGAGWRYSLTTGQFAVNNLTNDRSGAKTLFAH